MCRIPFMRREISATVGKSRRERKINEKNLTKIEIFFAIGLDFLGHPVYNVNNTVGKCVAFALKITPLCLIFAHLCLISAEKEASG